MNDRYKAILGEGLYPPLDDLEIFMSSQLGILFPRNHITLPEGIHAHSSYEFLIPFSPFACQRIENEKIDLEQNRIYPFNSWQEHGPWRPLEKANFCAVQIDRDFLQEVSRQICGQPTINFSNEGFIVDSHIWGLVKGFADEAENRQVGYEYILESLSAQIVVELIRRGKNNLNLSEVYRSGKIKENIRKSIAFLKESYTGAFSLNDIAREANLSPYYFVRVFKAETGKTPYEYLISLRIEKACFLLGGKDNNITEISYRCGFSNPSHFSSVFKKAMGVTPTKYRKELWEK